MTRMIAPLIIDPLAAYYLQDTRQTVGNSMLWWARDHKGYVCDIRKAHVFIGSDTVIQHCRDTDRPWPKDYIDQRVSHHIDHQHCDYNRITAPFGPSKLEDTRADFEAHKRQAWTGTVEDLNALLIRKDGDPTKFVTAPYRDARTDEDWNLWRDARGVGGLEA